MNENGATEQASSDGYNFLNSGSTAEVFLNIGETFEEGLIRSGFSLADALDFSAIFRQGIAFKVPEMVLYAIHALIANAGADRSARHEALGAVIGRLDIANSQGKQKRGMFNKLWSKGTVEQATNDIQG